MAMKINAGEVGRGDVFWIDPEQIIIDNERNGRKVEHDIESIMELVNSLLAHGQQQAAVVRRVEGNKVQLVSGYRRAAAIRHINEHSMAEKPMRLMVRVADMNSEDAFIANLVENMHRKDLTPIDHAHNQRMLRERYGWDDARIAEFYNQSISYVHLLRKTHQLAPDVQQDVQQGKLTLAASVDLVKLPENEQRRVVQAARGTDGKVNAGAVKRAVRAKEIDQGGGKSRSMKEVREWIEASATSRHNTAEVRKVSRLFLDFINGKITDEQMSSKLDKLIDGE